MNELAKLEPCPHCAGEAKFGMIKKGPQRGGEYIECQQCGASTNLQWSLKDDARGELAERWNRRAALSGDVRVPRERVRLLEAVLQQARMTLLVSIKCDEAALQRSLGNLNLACKAVWDCETKLLAAAKGGGRDV